MDTSSRVLFQTICCFALIAGWNAARAGDEEPGAITVTAGTTDPGVSSGKSHPVHHLFGNQTIQLPVTIEGRSEKPADVRARLVQLSFSLGAPLPPVEIVSGRVLSGDEPVSVVVSLPLPEVRAETDFALRFQIRTVGATWRDAGSTRLRVYARSILEALKPLSEHVVLRLKDDSGKLKSLLESLEVDVADYRVPVLVSGRPIITLLVNEDDALDPTELEVSRDETVVVFNERVRTLPKVVRTPWRGGHLIQVELEILGNLHRDPRVQKAFMEIIELARVRRDVSR